MARSVWKGPFVEESLIKKVEKQKLDPKKMPIKTWSRKSTIIPEFIGVSFLIYNGKKFIPVTISEDMVGHKLGEFSPTRTFFGHTPADKKAKETEAKGQIKTWSRKSTIIPEFIGVSFLIYNGKKFIPVTISEDMVGHKLGEFSPTRVFKGHAGNKKAVSR